MNLNNFKYRLSYYKDEAGEYTEQISCSLEDVLDIIQSNWPNESYPEQLKAILVENTEGQFLVLRYCKKNVFEAYYFDSNNRLYHKKSEIELLYDSLNYFFTNLIQLRDFLNLKTRDNEWARDEFLFKNHIYSMSKNRTNNQLSWLWMGIGMGLMLKSIFIYWIFTGSSDGLNILLSTIILLFSFVSWLSGILLHFQYLKDNKHLKVNITRGGDEISINTQNFSKVIKKNEILKVQQVKNETMLPWSEYGYLEIELKSGEIINLTNLMIDQVNILDKFRFNNIKKYTAEDNYPNIRTKSYLNPTN